MKLIKIKTDIIERLGLLFNWIKIKDNNYIIQSNEEDVSSNIIYIEELYRLGIINYRIKKSIYEYLALDFANLSTELKNKICEMCAMEINSIIAYYISIGLSTIEAIELYRENKATCVRNESLNCKKCYNDNKILKSIIKYVQESECVRLAKNIEELIYLFNNYAIYGLNYGNTTEGIMDFIDGTNYYSSSGLQTYLLYPSMSYSNLVNELHQTILSGSDLN